MFIKTNKELIDLEHIGRLALCNSGKKLIACYPTLGEDDSYSMLKTFSDSADALAELEQITEAIQRGDKVYKIED